MHIRLDPKYQILSMAELEKADRITPYDADPEIALDELLRAAQERLEKIKNTLAKCQNNALIPAVSRIKR